MFWARLSARYQQICSEGRQKNSVYFGVRAIISLIIGVVVVAGCLIGAYFIMTTIGESLLIIFAIVLAIGLAAAALVGLLNGIVASLICVIYQLRLNRGPMGWIALAVWVLFIGAAIGVLIWAVFNS